MDDPILDILIHLNYAERQLQKVREAVCRLVGLDPATLDRRT